MFNVLFWKRFPRKKISYYMGKLAKHPYSRYLIPIYTKIFKVDIEPIRKPLHEFNSLLEFFTREFHVHARPINPTEGIVVSPVDGTISQIGDIDEGKLIQAKGYEYSLEELLGHHEEYKNTFIGGKFVTIYLSPRDYHRIHMPVMGEIKELTYIPGDLYPVNRLGLEKIVGLFSINERIISYLHTQFGQMAMIKVGATNVGSIKVVFDAQVRTNAKLSTCIKHKKYREIQLNKGDEIGWFEFGSTVILLFEPNKIQWTIDPIPGTTVKMGESLACKVG